MSEAEDGLRNPATDAAVRQGAQVGDGRPGPAGSSGAEPAPRFDHIAVLGHIAWLMSQSKDHRDLFVSDLEWRVMPAVAHGQFRIWRQGNRPVAYASWAFVGPKQEARLKAGTIRLAPTEWRSGDIKVIVDVIAPLGTRESMVDEIVKCKIKSDPDKI